MLETCKDYNWFFRDFLKAFIKYFPEIVIRKRTIKQWYTTCYWHLWWWGLLRIFRYIISIFIIYIFYIIYKIIYFFLYIYDWSWIYEIEFKLPEISITEKLFWFWVFASIFEYILFFSIFKLYLWIIKAEKKFPRISTEKQRVFRALETRGFWSYFRKKTLSCKKNFINKHKEKKKELIYDFFFLKKHDVPNKFWFKLGELLDKFLTFIIWIRIAPEQLELKYPWFAKIYYYWLSIPYFIMSAIRVIFFLIKVFWICLIQFLLWFYYFRDILYKIPYIELICSKILEILYWIWFLSISLPWQIVKFTVDWFEDYEEEKTRKYLEKKGLLKFYKPPEKRPPNPEDRYDSAREAFTSIWRDMMAELGPKYKALFLGIWPGIKSLPRKFIMKIPHYWSLFKKNWIWVSLIFCFLPVFDLFFIFIVIESFFTYTYFFFFRKIWFKKDKKLFRRVISFLFLFIFVLVHFIVALYMSKFIIFNVLKIIIGLW